MRVINVEEVIALISRFNFRHIQIHHTWKPNHKGFNGKNHLQLQRNMKNYHINNNGWSDIGQHFTLMPDGKFVTGRPLSRTPA